jgi:hypothetical protein
MKTLLATLFLFSSHSFAQNLDVKTFKDLLSQRKPVLEKIYQGMAKKLVTKTKFEVDGGFCESTEVAVQTVLKIEGSKVIVHSQESFVPGASSACAVVEPYNISVLFYQTAPSLSDDLSAIDDLASDITALSKAGDIVSMSLGTAVFQYDLTQSSFKNLISVQDTDYSMVSSDLADINVNAIDLTRILFCESSDSDQCVEGDFSDILF